MVPGIGIIAMNAKDLFILRRSNFGYFLSAIGSLQRSSEGSFFKMLRRLCLLSMTETLSSPAA